MEEIPPDLICGPPRSGQGQLEGSCFGFEFVHLLWSSWKQFIAKFTQNGTCGNNSKIKLKKNRSSQLLCLLFSCSLKLKSSLSLANFPGFTTGTEEAVHQLGSQSSQPPLIVSISSSSQPATAAVSVDREVRTLTFTQTLGPLKTIHGRAHQ